MARMKVFDPTTQSWVYADKSFGKDGKTPVKGVDYFDGKDYVLTYRDKTEIAETIKAEVPLVKTAEQPIFVNSIDEMTDKSKVYVLLPEGYFYKNVKVEESASYTFTADDFVADALNTNGSLLGSGTPNRIATKNMIDLSAGTVSIYCPDPYEYIIYYYTDRAIANYIGKTAFKTGSITDVLNETVGSGTIEGAKFCRISLRDGTSTTVDLSGRIDEFMANIIISQASDATVENDAWKSTGLAYNQPADYENRIVAIESFLNGLKIAEDGEW